MTFHILMSWLLIISGAFSSSDVIRDIRVLKQDHLSYLDRDTSGAAMMSADEQGRMDILYNAAFFSPWHNEKPRYGRAEIEEELRIYRANPGYGENKRRYSGEWLEAVAANIGLKDFPNGGFRAITLANTDLRVLPTHKPHFNHCETGGCSYPFDNFQQSAVYVNTPVIVSHLSVDRAWVFVETGFTYGWLPAKDVAAVDAGFIKIWESGRYLVLIKDKVPIYTEEGRYAFHAPLGTIFPEAGRSDKGAGILVALGDPGGQAVIRKGVVPEDAATLKPLKLNRLNMAKVANELINEPYGWGGLYRNRDCSAMIRDLFAPFGVWLPRNSRHQALEGGRFIDLDKMLPKERERIILQEGVPYMTLLWAKGHIMLYMGRHDGEILVFHNFWSTRERNAGRRGSRKIVGHAAITTLHPGSKPKKRRHVRGYERDVVGLTVIGKPEPARTVPVR